eukprot:1740866-Lingulodinium_polyedra.AAC.1
MRRNELELRCPICRLDTNGTERCHLGCGRRCPHGRWPSWRACPDCPPAAHGQDPAAASSPTAMDTTGDTSAVPVPAGVGEDVLDDGD